MTAWGAPGNDTENAGQAAPHAASPETANASSPASLPGLRATPKQRPRPVNRGVFSYTVIQIRFHRGQSGPLHPVRHGLHG